MWYYVLTTEEGKPQKTRKVKTMKKEMLKKMFVNACTAQIYIELADRRTAFELRLAAENLIDKYTTFTKKGAISLEDLHKLKGLIYEELLRNTP